MLSRRELVVGGGVALAGCRTDPAPTSSSGPVIVAPTTARSVIKVVDAQGTRDGAGVALKRALGNRALSMLDPFLMLDEFRSDDPEDYGAGFPNHPHRGFETVTYMLEGAMEHRDSVGNHGRLVPGSAQWMTAGHGIVHSEMPKQERGVMWGYQLWVNLPRARKLIAPRYQDIAPGRIPVLERDGATVRVVAGSAFGATGPVSGIDVDPLFCDLTFARGAELEVPIASDHNAFVYVNEGAVRIGPRGGARPEIRAGQLAVLGPGSAMQVCCDAQNGRLLVFAGRPIGEPVARGGPFVMNTDAEIRQAWEEYRAGTLLSGA